MTFEILAKVLPKHGYDYHDSMMIAHAVVGGVATLLLAPAGVLVGRYLRSRPYWFKIHSTLQSLFVIFMFVAFGLAVCGITDRGKKNPQFSDKNTVDRRHHKFGLAVVLLVGVQGIIGIVSHYVPASVSGKGFTRWFHIAVGILTIAMGYALFYDGMYEWDTTSDNGTMVPKGVRAVYWILFAGAILAYLLKVFMTAFGKKSTVEHSEEGSIEEKA